MSDDDTLRFPGDADNGLTPDDKVPCAKCGTLIHMHTTRCPNCGIHFRGPAFEFDRSQVDDGAGGNRTFRWIAATVLAVIGIGLLWAVLLLLRR
ncbi:MAG: hypothetical protein GY778_13220 [bacterium]|nr:hypothetical protein [bacterium]